VHKMRRTTSVVVEQPGAEKVLVENVPELSCSVDEISHCMFTVSIDALLACQVRFLSACHEIKFSGKYRGLACVLLKCDRPSHLDWGCLGVVRAAGVDNRWKVPAVL